MEPLPAMKRTGHKSGMPRMSRANLTGLMPPMPELRAKVTIERDVEWRPEFEATDGSEFSKGSIAEIADVTGKCAMCHNRVPAVELRWRPNYFIGDKTSGVEEIQGYWGCRLCYARAGKFDVRNSGGSARAFHHRKEDERTPTQTEWQGFKNRVEGVKRCMRLLAEMSGWTE